MTNRWPGNLFLLIVVLCWGNVAIYGQVGRNTPGRNTGPPILDMACPAVVNPLGDSSFDDAAPANQPPCRLVVPGTPLPGRAQAGLGSDHRTTSPAGPANAWIPLGSTHISHRALSYRAAPPVPIRRTVERTSTNAAPLATANPPPATANQNGEIEWQNRPLSEYDNPSDAESSGAALETRPLPLSSTPSASTALPEDYWLPMQVPVGPATGRTMNRPPARIATGRVEIGPPVPATLQGIQECTADRFAPGTRPLPPGLAVQYYHRGMNGGYGVSDIEGLQQAIIRYGQMNGAITP